MFSALDGPVASDIGVTPPLSLLWTRPALGTTTQKIKSKSSNSFPRQWPHPEQKMKSQIGCCRRRLSCRSPLGTQGKNTHMTIRRTIWDGKIGSRRSRHPRPLSKMLGQPSLQKNLKMHGHQVPAVTILAMPGQRSERG